MDNNDDYKNNIQQDAFKNVQATSVSIGSINQSAQSFFKIQPHESNITPRRELLKHLKGKVEGWKEDYLYNNEWLQPLLQDMDELVASSNTREKGIPGKSHSQQFLQISIKDFFKKERITGRLLILGNPGAGKTAAKMQIAEELIICAENNYSEPIPFWFDLSSWNEQSLEKWLIVELIKEYGYYQKFWKKLLRNHQILPMLDNLDQLKLPRQVKCITAINDFLKKDKLIPLIVCCRLEGYNQFYQLALNGAVCLQPLSEQQVQDYCVKVKNIDLLETISKDSNLLNFAKTPFFLYLINFAYQSINIDKWQKLDSDEQRIYYLFDVFIDKNNQEALSHARGFYQLQIIYKTKARLAWLAKKLKEHSYTYFLIENIQPSWLHNENQKVRYRLFVALMITLFSFPICLIISGLMLMAFGKAQESIVEAMRDVRNILPIVISISFVTTILLAAMIEFLGLTKEIKPVETLKLPGHELIEALRLAQIKERCVTAISLSLTQKIPINDNSQQLILFIQQWTYSILGWILKVFIGWFLPPIALLRGLLIGLTGPNIALKKRAFPNQGIHQSLRNTVPYALIFGLIGLIFGVSLKLYEYYFNKSANFVLPHNSISFSMFFASLGVVLGILYTGLPVIQHFALRLVLSQDDLFPFKYADFLEHTKKYRLTQTYGGRYSYIHDLLRDYFANLRIDGG
ncbi:NACHT domain-containing protein [Nostoc sp.]